MYDYFIVTHLPAFYKINLYNEIALRHRIFVVFIASSSIQRTNDFVGHDCKFPFKVLNEGAFETRNVLLSIIRLAALVKSVKFRTVMVGGWDLWEFWFLTFICFRSRRALTLESTPIDSRCDGIRGFSKRRFLSRIHLVFASGSLHAQLATNLGFTGKTVITRGVGIINKIQECRSTTRPYQKSFLFLGRLAEEKNLHELLTLFHKLPECNLLIAGQGPLEESLRKEAGPNITWLGHVPNPQIDALFKEVDFLLLPSIRETWGLVVEEALARGVPVILSSNCGASELITSGQNGFIFQLNEKSSLLELIQSINAESYQTLLHSIQADTIDAKDRLQVFAYDV